MNLKTNSQSTENYIPINNYFSNKRNDCLPVYDVTLFGQVAGIYYDLLDKNELDEKNTTYYSQIINEENKKYLIGQLSTERFESCIKLLDKKKKETKKLKKVSLFVIPLVMSGGLALLYKKIVSEEVCSDKKRNGILLAGVVCSFGVGVKYIFDKKKKEKESVKNRIIIKNEE